jgi:enoyl-CoA hydratase/carnithine racemase
MAVVDEHREGAVAWLTIDAPPCNVMTREVFVALLQASTSLSADPDLTVVVLQSADPEFFLAHFDVELLLASPIDRPVVRGEELNAFDTMCERFRTMDKVTIAKIAGRVGGGGAELSLACDMRYGALGRAVVNQMEVPIGIIPGGGATQRLPQRIGWGRAMELIAGGVDLDAATGEQWGWFDRALPADELDAFVDGLARRIASFPPDAVRHAKAAMLSGVPDPTQGLLTESHHFDQTMAVASSRAAMQRFLDLGGQTRAGELIVDQIAARAATEPS